MINNLSAALDVMRPGLLETGLESIAYNLNRRSHALRFFEFGKSYHSSGVGVYSERNHLCLYITGALADDSWKAKSGKVDLFYLKGICSNLLLQLGISKHQFELGTEYKTRTRHFPLPLKEANY